MKIKILYTLFPSLFVIYIGIFALLFTVTYFVFKKAIKNGLIEAYREIEKMKHQDSQE